MKKFFLVFLIVLNFSFLGNISFATPDNRGVEITINQAEIDWIEFVFMNNLWYEIIHYTDGSRDIHPIAVPPNG